jgi:hypothetical protein
VQYTFKQISPEKAGVLATLGFAGTSFQMRNPATQTTNLHFEAEWFNHGGDFGSLNLKYSRLGWGCWPTTARASPPLQRPPGVANDNRKMIRRDNRNLSHPYEVFWKGSAVGQEHLKECICWRQSKPAEGHPKGELRNIRV